MLPRFPLGWKICVYFHVMNFVITAECMAPAAVAFGTLATAAVAAVTSTAALVAASAATTTGALL